MYKLDVLVPYAIVVQPGHTKFLRPTTPLDTVLEFLLTVL